MNASAPWFEPDQSEFVASVAETPTTFASPAGYVGVELLYWLEGHAAHPAAGRTRPTTRRKVSSPYGSGP